MLSLQGRNKMVKESNGCFFWADIVVDVTGCLSVNRVADLGLDK
jgi:hypothetical protein